MRHILTFCFLLCAFCISAQTWPKDSTWNAQENNVWFSYRQTTYENGSLALQKEFVGTDSVLASTKTTAIRQQSATMANDAKVVQKFRRNVTEIIRNAAATRTQIGIDPLRILQDELAPSLTGNKWEIRSDSTRTITFGVNTQGVLRYTVIGFPTRTVNVLGDIIRLNLYLGSKDPIDLYRDGSVWRNLNGSTVLRRLGESVTTN